MSVAVCCILKCDDKYLTVTRKEDATKIGLPGGKIDIGESCWDAIIREVFEETGLTLKENDLVPFYSSYCTYLDNKYWTVTFHHNGDIEKQVMVPEKGTKLIWSTEKDLCNPLKSPFHVYNKNLFVKLKELHEKY